MAKHIHFIGIGGIGVSGLAQLALKRGDSVSGSDVKESAITRKLASLGARIFIGHRAENIRDAELVVYSSAIRTDNPEMIEARQKNIALQRRAEFLNDLMTGKAVITVTGAHGKTTTSSLAAKLLVSVGLEPTVVVGGILREDGDNAKSGESSYFVAEADESDGSFLCYHPMYSIITNIDQEHMDFYKTTDNLLASFGRFVGQTKPEGCVFYCAQDQMLAKIVKEGVGRSVSYGFSSQADYFAENISLAKGRISFMCWHRGERLGAISMNLTGKHNVLNALAVVALGQELEIDFKKIQAAFKEFKGVERRFQIKYEDQDFLVVDDYGHHPTEIQATIEAACACARKRLVVVFQPHRYSRTASLKDQFAVCFSKCDHLVVTDIYAAGEDAIAGVNSSGLVDCIRGRMKAQAEYVERDKIAEHLQSLVKNGDLILFLGAGDITKVSDEFAKSFQKKN